MLSYEPGDSPAHGLDPRTKLAVQAGFAAAAFAHANPAGLLALAGVAGLALASARLSPVRALVSVRYALPFLLVAPLLEGMALGPPRFVPADAVAPTLAGVRVVLLLVVSAAYVRTTTVRESRAAVEWLLPGRAGRLVGTGVALVFRFLPVLRADLRRARTAMHARLGSRRPLRERMGLVATAGLRRAFDRTDRLALAMRSRCLAWNPTLPRLALTRRDLPALALAGTLAAAALV